MISVLDDKLWFPKPENATEDGLLAIGGDLSTERLLLAYRSGIFPWYNDDIPLWWYPNPRFVLFPNELKVTKSMKQILNKKEFEFHVNKNFKQVVTYCKTVERKEQDGTWINEDVVDAYTALHQLGFAHSAECWYNNKLVGGLYGIRLGKIFFGESMFSLKPNSSKFAFIKYVQMLMDEGIELIDCQVYTTHLESLGARMIAAKEFEKLLRANVE